jgi:hypothetical protein
VAIIGARTPAGGFYMSTSELRRFGIGLLVAFVLQQPAPAAAERIASRADEPSVARAADLTQVKDALARDAVATALAEHGLTTGEVEQRLGQLSDEDLRQLASNLDEIQAAGNVPNYIWILLAIFLAVSILAIIF